MKLPLKYGLLAAPLLALVAPARAQPMVAPATGVYAGPRYPGGPDSLRTYVARQLRDASPAWVGDVFLQLDFDATGNVQKAEYLAPPPGTPAATLVRNQEVRALVTRLVRQMPRWQPRSPESPTGSKAPTLPFVLRLPFGSNGPVALAYADQFPTPAELGQREPASYPAATVAYLQRQYRYPADALRAQVQGVMYVYFEVSEAGVIEQRRLVGSLLPSTDAETLRVLQSLPDPGTPPRQQGRPVRAYYVLPITLRIM